jgi:hypothetical protein
MIYFCFNALSISRRILMGFGPIVISSQKNAFYWRLLSTSADYFVEEAIISRHLQSLLHSTPERMSLRFTENRLRSTCCPSDGMLLAQRTKDNANTFSGRKSAIYHKEARNMGFHVKD